MIIQSLISDRISDDTPHIRLALYQGFGTAGNMDAGQANLAVLEETAATAKNHGVHLLSFLEPFLSGYDVTDAATAHHLAEEIQSEKIFDRVAEAAKRNRLALICPYPEAATVAGERRYYDSIIVYGADGEILKNYRKTHLWGGDERAYWSFGYVYPEEGEAYSVFKVNGVRVGVLNCYEAEFPELCRILALKGAQLVVIPTAADDYTILRTGERTMTPYPDVQFLIKSNAYHTGIFCAYSNRRNGETVGGNLVGGYLGNSCLADPHGNFLIPVYPLPPEREDEPGSGGNDNMLLIAECVPRFYAPTHPETKIHDKEAATHYIPDRRRNLYQRLVSLRCVDQNTGEEKKYSEQPG
ncbi:MAG: nitrilase-related carbon-nitrogen hydrolase [Deltaproteobacteria bacterium]